MEHYPIRKLVLPVAGLGKRLMPLTLTTPKNLLPLGGRPILDHIIEETVGTTIEEVVLVISPQHRAAFEHFVKAAEAKYPNLTFHIRVQEEPLGHGHALYQAADIYRDEPVLVRFCDDIIASNEPNLFSFLELYARHGKSMVLLERVPYEQVSRYGVVSYEKLPHRDMYRIKTFVEKPSVEKAPSNLIVPGAYILKPDVLALLPGMIQNMAHSPDALLIPHLIAHHIGGGGEVYGWEYPGIRLDCGTLEGYEAANKFVADHERDSR